MYYVFLIINLWSVKLEFNCKKKYKCFFKIVVLLFRELICDIIFLIFF